MDAPHVCARAHCTRTSQANTCTHISAPSSSSHVGAKLPTGESRGRCPVSTAIGHEGCRGDGPSLPSSLLVPRGFTCRPSSGWSLCSIPPPRQGDWGPGVRGTPATSLATPGHLLWARSLQGTCWPGGRPCGGNAPAWALS